MSSNNSFKKKKKGKYKEFIQVGIGGWIYQNCREHFYTFHRPSSGRLFPLFNGISTFVGYLMPKPSFEKNSSGTI